MSGALIIFGKRYDLVVWMRDYFEGLTQAIEQFVLSNDVKLKVVETGGCYNSSPNKFYLNDAWKA